MSAADIIIVVLIVLAVAGLIAVACLRKNKSPCSHCPYKRDCDSHCVKGKKDATAGESQSFTEESGEDKKSIVDNETNII